MFLLNSRYPLLCATKCYFGTPYPEVTELICRVPSTLLSQASSSSRRAHQCRFTVRSFMKSFFVFFLIFLENLLILEKL